MTPEEAQKRREAVAKLSDGMTNDGTALAGAILYLADALRPAVEAFVEATKIGGALGPRWRT